MFRSALADSLRYLHRGKLYAAISVFGLAVGLSMALLAAMSIRIDLPLWLFPVTALAILLVALATVGAHALRFSSTRPVEALRHV